MSEAPPFRYLAISERSVCPEPIPDRVDQLFEMGVPAVQIRDKSVADRERHRWLTSITSKHRKSHRLLVNGRADLALLANADGVHRPSDGVPLKELRELLPDSSIIGVSTHNHEEVRTAAEAGADYVTFGPVYPTESKPELSPSDIPGPDGLELVCKQETIPVFGLGGINSPRQVEACLDAGAHGVAGIRALFGPEDAEPVWSAIAPILEE